MYERGLDGRILSFPTHDEAEKHRAAQPDARDLDVVPMGPERVFVDEPKGGD